MLQFIIKRMLLAVPTILVISVISFIIIELPPGDFIDSYIKELEAILRQQESGGYSRTYRK